MSLTFKQAETQANAILRNDKAKLQWAKLTVSDMPADIQQLAKAAVVAELAAAARKAELQEALNEKVEAPRGKRLIVTLGRQVSLEQDHILYAWGDVSASSTRVVSFDQFVKG